MGFFVGKVMKEMQGKANPESVRKSLAAGIEKAGIEKRKVKE